MNRIFPGSIAAMSLAAVILIASPAAFANGSFNSGGETVGPNSVMMINFASPGHFFNSGDAGVTEGFGGYWRSFVSPINYGDVIIPMAAAEPTLDNPSYGNEIDLGVGPGRLAALMAPLGHFFSLGCNGWSGSAMSLAVPSCDDSAGDYHLDIHPDIG